MGVLSVRYLTSNVIKSLFSYIYIYNIVLYFKLPYKINDDIHIYTIHCKKRLLEKLTILVILQKLGKFTKKWVILHKNW